MRKGPRTLGRLDLNIACSVALKRGRICVSTRCACTASVAGCWHAQLLVFWKHLTQPFCQTLPSRRHESITHQLFPCCLCSCEVESCYVWMRQLLQNLTCHRRMSLLDHVEAVRPTGPERGIGGQNCASKPQTSS